MPKTKYESEKQPTLEELQKFVGGNIQIVEATNGDQIIMDKEGKCKNKEFNPEATKHWLGDFPWYDIIVGDIMILNDKAKLD